jgi:hypothetical protein
MSPEQVARANAPVTMRRTDAEEMLKDVTDGIGTMIDMSSQENAMEVIDSLKALRSTQLTLRGLLGKRAVAS